MTENEDIRQAYNWTELTEEIAKITTIAYSLGKGEPQWPAEKDIKDYRNWYSLKKISE